MKLGVFIDSVNVEDLKEVKGFVGMIGGSCDCKKPEQIFNEAKADLEKLRDLRSIFIDEESKKLKEDLGEEKYEVVLEKMEDLKKLCKKRYAEKKGKKLEQVFKEADSIITDKKPIIDAIKGMSNKPTWDEAPESAQILAYSLAFGWMFGSYKDAKPNELGVTWVGEGYGTWFKPKYNRMDETVINWKTTLEKRPAKTLTVEEAAKRIEKIIQKPKPKTLDPELKRFYDKLKGFDPVTRKTIKEKTGKTFGLMPQKYKLVSQLINAGKMKKVEDGKWQMM